MACVVTGVGTVVERKWLVSRRGIAAFVMGPQEEAVWLSHHLTNGNET